MRHPSDLLIGLHAGTSTVRAAAFDRTGRSLGIARVPVTVARLPDGGVEQDQAEAWQATARSVRLLAQQVPDLARRTAALSITGRADGTWLIDEDGDPVGPALLWLDARAAGIVEGWCRSGTARAVPEITGTGLGGALQSAQLGWLQCARPQMIEAAATAFHVKDWLYFCCTGERATDPAEAIATFGDLRTGAYDEEVLRLLGLEEAARLLPEIVDGSRDQGALLPAASAALGLWEGTPVVLAPPDTVTSALAAGLPHAGPTCAASMLGAANVHIRWRQRLGPEPSGSTVPVAGGQGFCRFFTHAAPVPGLDWVTGLCQQLLADTGLIGISGRELAAMLEQKVGQAEPGGALLRSSFLQVGDGAAFPGPGERVQLLGTSDRTSLYDLMRATYEAQGYAARASHHVLGDRPAELRLMGEAAGRPALRTIIAACVGAPVRRLRREDAAAAGAAWFAAVSLGACGRMSEGVADWVEPYLDDLEPPDAELCSAYELLSALGRERSQAPAAA